MVCQNPSKVITSVSCWTSFEINQKALVPLQLEILSQGHQSPPSPPSIRPVSLTTKTNIPACGP